MARVNNPRKQFQFQITIPGLNPFLCQEVKTPDQEFDNVEHGDANFMVKTAGMKKISMLTVSSILAADSTDRFFQDWANQIQDTSLGGGDLPENYKRHVLVEEFSNDGVTVIERWEYAGVWPQKINGRDLSRKASENTVQSIEFCVDEVL